MKKFLLGVACAALCSTLSFSQQSAAPAPAPAAAAPAPASRPATASAAAPAAVAPPAHPITLVQVHEIFRAAGTEGMLKQMMHQGLAMQRSRAPEYVPASVWDELESSLANVDFAAMIAPVYQRYLSEEDAEKAIAFYKTPEGQRYIAAFPSVMQMAMSVGQQQGAMIARQVFSKHEQEIMAAKKKYDDEQKAQQNQLAKPAASATPATPATPAPPAGKPEPVKP